MSLMETLPIKTIFTPHATEPRQGELHTAKSALAFRNWRGEKEILLGFKSGSSRSICELVSRAEVCERFVATYDFQKQRLGCSPEPYCGKAYFSKHPLSQMFHPAHILLAPTPTDSLAMDPLASPGASGLSFHTQHEMALEHAALELLERHLLSELWYGNTVQLMTHSQVDFAEDMTLSRLTVAGPYASHLCLSTLHHHRLGHWSVGAAFSLIPDKGFAKSDMESFMLMENHLQKNDGYCSNDATRAQAMALGNAQRAHKSQMYLQSKIVPHQASQEKYLDLPNALTLVASLENLFVVDLYDSNQAYGLRAIHPDLRTLKRQRATRASGIPPDPFL